MYIKNFAGDRNKFIGLDLALKKALSQGFALYSPDELTYFRKGDNFDYDYFEYIKSTLLLAQYRLFASLEKLDTFNELGFQILLAITNISYELLKMAQEIIRVPLICIKALAYMSILHIPHALVTLFELPMIPFNLIGQTFRVVPATVLFISSILGAFTRLVVDKVISTTKEKSEDNPELIAEGFTYLEGDINGSPVLFLSQLEELVTKQFTVLSDDFDGCMIIEPLRYFGTACSVLK